VGGAHLPVIGRCTWLNLCLWCMASVMADLWFTSQLMPVPN